MPVIRNSQKSLVIALLALIVFPLAFFIALPRATAALQGQQPPPNRRKLEGEEGERAQRARDLAAQARRQFQQRHEENPSKGELRRTTTEARQPVPVAEAQAPAAKERDDDEEKQEQERERDAGGWRARLGEPYDKPREAAEFFQRKRLAEGETVLPVEKYFAAQEQTRRMPRFSTRLNRTISNDERPTIAPLGSGGKVEGANLTQDTFATWTSLGPGNIGGRTRALLINPNDPNVMYAAGVSGGAWKSINAGQSWTPLGDMFAVLTVSSMVFEPGNPNTIYLGTGEGFSVGEQDTLGDLRGAGIFKTTDAGATWTRLEATKNENFYYVNDLVISPNDKQRIYAATRNGVWRSNDGGANWSRILDPKNEDGDTVTGGALDLAIRTDVATDFIFASCGTFEKATVYRNPDAAGTGANNTWTAVLSEEGMGRTSLAIAPSNQNIVYALASSIEDNDYQLGLYAVFRSTSGGESDSWTAQVRNTSPVKLNRLLLSNPIVATLTDCQFDLGDGFISQGWYDNVIAVDPADPNKVWAGGIDLFRSDDGGANWGVASYWWIDEPGAVKLSPYAHADNHVIVFHPNYNGASNQTIFVGSDGGLFRSQNARAAVATGPKATCRGENSNIRWLTINNNYGVTQFYNGAVTPDGTRYFGGTQDNGTVLGTDATGVNGWREVNGGDGGYVAVDPNFPETYYASFTDFSFVKSTDAGITFGSSIAGINDGGLFITPFAIDPSDGQRLWTGGDYIWRTDNGAGRWVRASAITDGASKVSSIAIAPTDSNRVLVGMGDGYIHRNNAALTATGTTVWPSTRPRRGWVSSVAFDPNNKDIAYATYSTFGGIHVYRSTDGGQSWAGIDGTGNGAIPDIPVHSIVVDPTNSARLYIGTDTGVLVSNNTGGSWAVEDTGFPNVITESLQINVTGGTTRLYAFTHGRGAWRVPLAVTGPNANCNFTISTPTVSVAQTASSGTLKITAGPGACTWTAASNAPWLKVTGGGTGNGTINYTVDENTTFAARTATATIAGRSFVVTQPGRIDTESPVVAVTDPAGAPPANTSGFISLAGTATDNNAVTAVTYTTDRGASGTATYTAATGRWVANNIPLAPGQNVITITARDAAGNLGRTTYTVFSKPDASLATIAGNGTRGYAGDGGPATDALITRPIRLDIDGAGNLYFTDSDNHVIRKVAPNGTITTVAGTGTSGFSGDGGPATSAQLNFPIGVAVDGSGNVYVCDNGNVRIRKITAATGVISTIAGTGTAGYSGDGGPGISAQINNPQNVETDAAGNVFIADFANNRIRKVALDGTITTVAGNGTAGFSGDGDLATAARLNSPNNVSTDAAGNLIISDAANNRIRKVTVSDGKIATIAGNGTAGFSGDGGLATEARLSSPACAIADAAGNLYISDRGNQRVRKVTAGTNLITTIVGTGTAGFNGDGLAALASTLNFPTGLALDPAGNLYIGDRDNGRIRKLIFAGANDTVAPTIAITAPSTTGSFTTTTGVVTITGTASDNVAVFQVRWSNDRGGSGVASGTTAWTISNLALQNGVNNITITAWDAAGNAASVRLAITFNPNLLITAFAGTGGAGNFGDAGPAIAAGISPLGLAVNSGGTLYVTDDESHRVRQINAAGTINAFAGSGALGSSGDNGPALNAAFNFPTDVVADASGNVYISDTNNHRVRRVAPDGTIKTVAGTGEADFTGDNGPATQATLVGPSGLAVDAAGNLYIADTGNARIRKVTAATGVITTVAGNGDVAFAGDGGQATAASFKSPWGLAVDRNGVLYVGDIRDQRIRRIGTDGVITTIAGTGTAGYDGDNKPAKNARIYLGGSGFGGFMTTDAMNDLVFADFANNRVRKITMTTGIITTIAGAGASGTAGDNGDPARAQLALPTDVAIAPDGTLYIADWGNYRIRKIAATTSLRTVATTSAASFLGDALATESIAAAFGTNLASATASATTVPLPTSLSGTTVRVRDAAGAERLAPLFFVSPLQVNFLIPPSTAPGAATITINGPDGTSSTGVVQIVSAAPGLFSANSDGTGVAAALVLRIKSSGEQIYEPLARLDPTTNKYVPVPIDLGPDTDQVFLILFGTGARFRSSLAASSATVGGAPADLLYVGPQGGFAGLDQINLRLNRALIGRGEVEVRVTTDGRQSNAVKIAIK